MTNLRIGIWSVLVLAVVAAVLAGCSSAAPETESADDPVEGAAAAEVQEEPYILQTVPEFTIEITSAAVSSRGRLNKYYTCEGADASPDLAWGGAPDGTQSFVVLMEDPASDEIEGGAMWTHWILYSIPPTITSLPEQLPGTATLDNGATYGINDYGNAFYSGPCPEPTTYVPPQGCQGTGSGCSNKDTIPAKLRAYHFYIYALDVTIDLAPGATRNQILQEIEGHIIGAGELAPEFRSTISKIEGSRSTVQS